MSCDFETVPCGLPGNFICKKCKVCGHQIGLPERLVAEKWDQILADMKSPCSRNKEQPVSGRTYAEVAAKMATTRAPVEAFVAPTPAPPQPAAADPTANAPDPFIPKPDTSGPGAQLKKFLSRVGIRSTPTCSCNARANYMDSMGVEWCEQNIDMIVGWLKEESEKRNLPFLDWPARILVKKAIAASKKAHAIKLKKLGH